MHGLMKICVADINTRPKGGEAATVGNYNIDNNKILLSFRNVTPRISAASAFGTLKDLFLRYLLNMNASNRPVTGEISRKSNIAPELTILKNLNIIAEYYQRIHRCSYSAGAIHS